MIHIQLKVSLRRIPRRAILLGFLQRKAVATASLGLYRTLQWPHLRFPVLKYPKRRKPIFLLACMPAVIPKNKYCPSVVGLSQSVATAALTALGLTVTATFIADSQVAGTVLNQSIVPGAIVFAGQAILLNVSTGPTPLPPGFRVRAVTAGIYHDHYYNPGDVFDLATANDFSDATVNIQPLGEEYAAGWMVRVAATTPLYEASSDSPIPSFPAVDPARRTVL